MKKFLILASLLVSSFSLAAPLMGTTQSVALSNFCKKYKCSIISNEPYNPSGDPSRFKGYKKFVYTLSGMGTLEIIRNERNVINDATITFNGVDEFNWARSNNGMYTNDYSMTFLGIKASKSLNSACLDSVVADDTPPTAIGVVSQNGLYKFMCLASVEMEGMPTKTSIALYIGPK